MNLDADERKAHLHDQAVAQENEQIVQQRIYAGERSMLCSR